MRNVGARTAAEPNPAFVLADEYPGMLLPVAVFDPNGLAFLESVGGLAHRVRLAVEQSTPDHRRKGVAAPNQSDSLLLAVGATI